jgi:hypothetical protein
VTGLRDDRTERALRPHVCLLAEQRHFPCRGSNAAEFEISPRPSNSPEMESSLVAI